MWETKALLSGLVMALLQLRKSLSWLTKSYQPAVCLRQKICRCCTESKTRRNWNSAGLWNESCSSNFGPKKEAKTADCTPGLRQTRCRRRPWHQWYSMHAYKKTKDINKHLPCLEAPPVCLGIGAFSFCPPRFSVNRSLDKKSLERLSPWLACHYH